MVDHQRTGDRHASTMLRSISGIKKANVQLLHHFDEITVGLPRAMYSTGI
jgi:hypothetical protein